MSAVNFTAEGTVADFILGVCRDKGVLGCLP